MAVRALIVGVGSRGRDWVRLIRAAPEYELAGCVDIDPLARAQAMSLGVPADRCLADTARALDTIPSDVAIVATPVDDHAATCELALSQGRAVLVEKPFTTSLRDAARLVALADRVSRPLIVGHNYRYMRAFRTVRRLVHDGALGRLRQLRFQYLRGPHAMRPSHAERPHCMLWGAGVHHVDLLRYITGDRVTGVCGDEWTGTPGSPLQGASLDMLLTFAGGARARYAATYESSGHEFFERGQEFYARLVGDRGTLHVLHRWLVLCEVGKLPRIIRRGRRASSEEQILLDQMSRWLGGGEEPESSGRDNLRTMAIVEAFLQAAAEHRWVNPQELALE